MPGGRQMKRHLKLNPLCSGRSSRRFRGSESQHLWGQIVIEFTQYLEQSAAQAFGFRSLMCQEGQSGANH
jgi:hypothetical protein